MNKILLLAVGMSAAALAGMVDTYRAEQATRHVGYAIQGTGVPGGTPVPSKNNQRHGPTGILAAKRDARKRRNRAAARRRAA